jgi:hypothetical protein
MREIDDEFARARRLLAQMQDAIDRWQAAFHASSAGGDTSKAPAKFEAVTKKLEEAYEDMQRAIDAKLEHDWDRGRAS